MKNKAPLKSEALIFSKKFVLLTQTECLDNCTITVDVVRVEVLQQLTTLTYQHGQCGIT